MERCAAMLIPDPASMRGHWKDEMPEAREIRLEIGCGKGRFTVETAAAGPDVLFVAIERVADAMVIAMERANEQGIANVRFIDADAERLPAYFAPGEVSRIYLNFSDPWPPQPPRQAPFDPHGLFDALPADPAGKGRDPYEDRQSGPV